MMRVLSGGRWLATQHKVCLVPGSSCGSPVYVWAAFAILELVRCREAAARLKRGLQQLVNEGAAAIAPVTTSKQ